MPPSPDPGPSLTHDQASKLLTHFATFLTLALHTLLYHRSLYPEGTFLAARAYGLPVRQSRHAGVCSWVADAVAAVVAQLRVAAVERVVFVVYEKSVVAAPAPPVRPAPAVAPTSAFAVKSVEPKKKKKKEERPKKKPGGGGQKSFAVLERWIFDVSNFPVWPEEDVEGEGHEDKDRDVEVEGEEEEDDDDEELSDDDAEEEEEEELIWEDVNESLRGALGRLASAAETMPRLPDGCPFTLAIELRSEAPPPIDDPQPWIPFQPPLQSCKGKQRRLPPKDKTTTPIRAVQAGPLFFECWVEQSPMAKKEKEKEMKRDNDNDKDRDKDKAKAKERENGKDKSKAQPETLQLSRGPRTSMGPPPLPKK